MKLLFLLWIEFLSETQSNAIPYDLQQFWFKYLNIPQIERNEKKPQKDSQKVVNLVSIQ